MTFVNQWCWGQDVETCAASWRPLSNKKNRKLSKYPSFMSHSYCPLCSSFSPFLLLGRWLSFLSCNATNKLRAVVVLLKQSRKITHKNMKKKSLHNISVIYKRWLSFWYGKVLFLFLLTIKITRNKVESAVPSLEAGHPFPRPDEAFPKPGFALT